MNQVGFGALWPILLVLTSGWLLLQSRYGKTFVWWQSGYNLYFRIAFAGILCFSLGLATATTFAKYDFPIEFSCGGDNRNALIALFFQCQNEILSLATWLTLMFGVLGYFSINFFPPDSYIGKKHEAIIREKDFEGYIKNALDKDLFLSITLENRKVYIGWVSSAFYFNELDTEEKYIRLTVMLSGYRNEDDLRMYITIDYMEKNLESNQEIIIPVRKIVSIQPFDPEIYERTFVGQKEVAAPWPE